MPTKPSAPSEADVIFNRASVALAKSQRLVASWLPPPTPSELANAKSEEEIEQEIFTPVPELLGLGASVPKDGEIKRLKGDTDEKLRRQILGKDYNKLQSNGMHNSAKSGLEPVGHVGVKSRPTPAIREAEGSDEEGGRSSLGKSKRRKLGQPMEAIQAETASSVKARPPHKPTNYLDEVLAERSQKRSKKIKKSKKMKHTNAAT